MFWIITIAMLVIWFTLPDDHSQWSGLSEKPKPTDNYNHKPPDVKRKGKYDKYKH